MDNHSDDESLDLLPLHSAVLNGDVDLVNQLIEAGHNIEQKDDQERTALYISSQMGEEDIVRLLLRKGAEIEAMTTVGYTSLHTATEQNHAGIVKILLAHGADINTRDRSWGATPLTMACFWSCTETVRVLLEAGADTSQGAYFDYSPLGCAAFKGNKDIVALLLQYKKGVNIEAKTNGGLTPLMHAIANSFPEIVEMLLQHGADVNAASETGATALHILAQKEHVDVSTIKLLMTKGANPLRTDNNGNTALHVAAKNNQIDVAKLLVQSKVPLNVQNDKGNTALHIASEKGAANMSRYLQQVGADASIQNSHNYLAIDLAYCADHHYIVEMLKQVSQLSVDIQNLKAEYKRSLSQTDGPHRSTSGPVAAPRQGSKTSSQRSGSPSSRTGSQKSFSHQRFYQEIPDDDTGKLLPKVDTDVHPTEKTKSKESEVKSRDTYILPIKPGEAGSNVPHYQEIDSKPTNRLSVNDLPDISLGTMSSSASFTSLPSSPDTSIPEQYPSSTLQMQDRLYNMGIRQGGLVTSFQQQQLQMPNKPATEQKKKSKNPFKYFLQKREKSETSKAVAVNTRTMTGIQTGQVKICRELELLPLQPELKNIVSQVYIEFDRLILGDLIGRGNFGRVYQGSLKTQSGYQKVAIKSTKYKAEETEMIEDFLQEALLMKDFKHPHVLALIGVTFDLSSNPLVVLPFMSHGNLRAYIRDPRKTISVHRLLGLALQVGRGMEYLSKYKFVHRDLACRNCMVDEADGDTVVKVADFGLSRDLYFKDYYRISDRMTPLPVRWMAPESLQTNIFKLESDVWSFGVLVWELLTRGATPYADVENWDINKYIAKGYRLDKPTYCPDKIYGVLQACWNMDPAKRPGFSTIIQELEDHIHGEVYQSAEVNPSHHLASKTTYFV